MNRLEFRTQLEILRTSKGRESLDEDIEVLIMKLNTLYAKGYIDAKVGEFLNSSDDYIELIELLIELCESLDEERYWI